MDFHYADTLEKHNWVGGELDAYIYHVTPTIVVKTVRCDRAPEQVEAEHPFIKEIAFFKRLNEYQDRYLNIVECFLMLPDHLFLSYCTHKSISPCFYERQEREKNLNLKLTDFGRATTIGQFLEGTLPPRAQPLRAGPLQGTYGLCSARTEQFALGALLYFMVYGHEPYDDVILSGGEWDRRFGQMEFPELDRNEIFDGLISACWYNVYPTMALLTYDFKRKTKDIASNAEHMHIDIKKETENCEALPDGDTHIPIAKEAFSAKQHLPGH
ncbi:hypothetical protein MYU51_010503 [Penicillium brevicompactum]